MRAYAKRCARKFAKLDTLNTLVKEGGGQAVAARRAKKELTDDWTRRKPSPGTFWKAKNARPL